MPKQLSSLQKLLAAEVSLVRRGANKKKPFPIFKSEEEMPNVLLAAVLETEQADENQLVDIFKESNCSEKGQVAAIGALRILKSFEEELPREVVEKLAEMTGIRKEEDMAEYTFPKVSDAEELKKFLAEMPDEIRKSLVPAEPKEEPKKEDILKSLPEEAQAILKEQADKIATLEKSNEANAVALKKERDERELAEWVGKAEKDLSHYPGESSVELGKSLKDLHDIKPEMATKEFERMKKASEAMKGSAILKSVGFEGGENDSKSAEQELLKKAGEIVEKGADGMTPEKAFTKAMEQNPDLYQKYLDENPKQTANG